MQLKKILFAILMFWAVAARADYQLELLAASIRSSAEVNMENQASEIAVDISPQKIDYEDSDDDEDDGGDIEFDTTVRF
jgi:hypothetical protein